MAKNVYFCLHNEIIANGNSEGFNFNYRMYLTIISITRIPQPSIINIANQFLRANVFVFYRTFQKNHTVQRLSNYRTASNKEKYMLYNGKI